LTSVEQDLSGINRHRYQSQLRCLEEFVEAIAFVHYLQTQTLVSLAEAAAQVPAEINLTENDYLFGVFDVFGEMMRFATVAAATSGSLGDSNRNSTSGTRAVFGAQPDETDAGTGYGADDVDGKGKGSGRSIVSDIHELSTAFEVLPEIPTKDYRTKMQAMRQSVLKVEKLAYSLAIRGEERPRGWVPDMKDEGQPGLPD
jgi:predicted translin family RNA/ssDNA-binding protein